MYLDSGLRQPDVDKQITSVVTRTGFVEAEDRCKTLVLVLVCAGNADPGEEEERRQAEKRILPDPVEEARGQTHHPAQTDPGLPGCQQAQ